MKKVFNHNTHLGVKVKTVVNNDRVLKVSAFPYTWRTHQRRRISVS
jgi:hypothetical protein